MAMGPMPKQSDMQKSSTKSYFTDVREGMATEDRVPLDAGGCHSYTELETVSTYPTGPARKVVLSCPIRPAPDVILLYEEYQLFVLFTPNPELPIQQLPHKGIFSLRMDGGQVAATGGPTGGLSLGPRQLTCAGQVAVAVKCGPARQAC